MDLSRVMPRAQMCQTCRGKVRRVEQDRTGEGTSVDSPLGKDGREAQPMEFTNGERAKACVEAERDGTQGA